MEKEILVNDKVLTSGQATAIPLPNKKILLSFVLYSAVSRYIDLVMMV